MDKLSIIRTLLTTAIASVFSASLVLDVVSDPSWRTILTCAIKLIMIIIFGVFGMVGGYNLSSVRETRELAEKADEQARFMKWCGMSPQKNTPVVTEETVKAVE